MKYILIETNLRRKCESESEKWGQFEIKPHKQNITVHLPAFFLMRKYGESVASPSEVARIYTYFSVEMCLF